jgi:hypothetical protein
MARKAREISSMGMYFVKLKGENLFKNDEDRKVFLELTEKYFSDGEIYDTFLSKEEIKMVVKEPSQGISMAMKSLSTSYARYFNRVHNLTGKLFSDRFASEPIESDAEKQECIDNLTNPTAKRKPRGTVKQASNTKIEKKPQIIKEKAEKKVEITVIQEETKEIQKPKKKKMPSYLL